MHMIHIIVINDTLVRKIEHFERPGARTHSFYKQIRCRQSFHRSNHKKKGNRDLTTFGFEFE